MPDCLIEEQPDNAIPVVPIEEDSFSAWLDEQPEDVRRWVERTCFSAKPGSVCLIPRGDGDLAGVLTGITTPNDPWVCGDLPVVLPEGSYYLEADWSSSALEHASIGWALGAYEFTRYKPSNRSPPRLVIHRTCDAKRTKDQVQAILLVRDLINTPAEDMMPEQLANAIVSMAQDFDAQVKQIVGNELLEQQFPAIHAVGRASNHPPRLIELRWGDETNRKLTLVGKGVCFDSGGLDLKGAAGMRLMKKDMGGAAHAIGLARTVMSADLPVRLRVLIPAVENAVSGNALRPGDVISSRNGLTIEIDNTDAEGRLILCDALAEAVAEEPDLVLDFATLTGAARVALGTDVPALFCNSDELATGLLSAAESVGDPIWRLPLYKPYRELIESKFADIANSSSTPFAGAVTAALFLQEFVPDEIPWAHFDLMAWNMRNRPGRPEGGEAMGLRAVFKYLAGCWADET